MSDLYRIILSEKGDQNGLNISIHAVNNEDQEIPTKAVFYFAVIGSIYWEFSSTNNSNGFGIMIDKYSNKNKIKLKIPILEEYVKSVNDYIIKGYQGKILETFEKREQLEEMISINIISSQVDSNNCVSANIQLSTKYTEFLDILKKVKQVGVVFDQDYF